ncbi:HYR domain-containing protein [Paenibacillus rhizoplanae]
MVTEIFAVTVKNDAPAEFPLGTTKVTWTITDEHGNATKGTQEVKIVDTTKPVITAPEDLTVEATAVRSKVALGEPVVFDLFETGIINDAPVDFPVGTTLVTWMASDPSGNVAIAKQKVTVVDTTAPKLSIPADVKVEATGIRTPVMTGEATATDIFFRLL